MIKQFQEDYEDNYENDDEDSFCDDDKDLYVPDNEEQVKEEVTREISSKKKLGKRGLFRDLKMELLN